MNLLLKSTIVLIPAFNASQSLSELVTRLKTLLPEVSILIVDDGSTDETATIAGRLQATVIRHAQNKGKGAALQTGFNYVLHHVLVDYVLTLDADLQHLPEDAPAFFDALQRMNADVLVGWRQRVGTNMPFIGECPMLLLH